MIIRWATPQDEAAFRLLWQGFLDYYDVNLAAEVTDFTWKRLIGDDSPLSLRLACEGEQVLGFAIHHTHPSTWVMGDDCYLEDLFVAQGARGKGVGRALIDDLIVLARAKGCKRLYWNTDKDNTTAQHLYNSYTKDDGHIRYRLTL
jgi:GNAT superfamily N-acetyltransferase